MQFRYLKDPLFLFCVVLYFINRWIFKPFLPNEFSQGYLNDVICIPFWVPIMLFLMKKMHLRKSDAPPAAHEILIPLVLWSWVFEAYLPFTAAFKHLATSDYKDVLSYTVGACFAAVLWRVWYGHPEEFHPTKRRVSKSHSFQPSLRDSAAPARGTQR
jgi:hypothetical protein